VATPEEDWLVMIIHSKLCQPHAVVTERTSECECHATDYAISQSEKSNLRKASTLHKE